jgi:histidinol-phosphatase (PHP family)
MINPSPNRLVSVHGAHSGEFCRHAVDALEDIVREYIRKGFDWIGITEHIPPPGDAFLYPDEKSAGLDAAFLNRRFARYMQTARRLQQAFHSELTILVGFETETYSGYADHILRLIEAHRPDYIVGSIHHVDDAGFDFSAADYRHAVSRAGGLENLYCRYFDQQYEMIRRLKPAVVGHMDLIRIFDDGYRRRLEMDSIRKRITRNLNCIRDLGLTLDFNLRSLYKGADEPYLSEPILTDALALGIPVVPGDDSHGVSSVGCFMDRGIELLEKNGGSTTFMPPRNLMG